MLARIALVLAAVVPTMSFTSTPTTPCATTENFFPSFAGCQLQNSVPCLFNNRIFSESVVITTREFPPNGATRRYEGIQGAYDFFCSFWSRFANAADPRVELHALELFPGAQQIWYAYAYPPGNVTQESILWTLGECGAETVFLNYLGAPFIEAGEPGYYCEDPSTVDGLEYWNANGELPPP